MFIDFSFMSVLLFCLCSGKRSLCIIICERSEMSEVSFWCGVQTSYEAPPVLLAQFACERFSALAYVRIAACGCRSLHGSMSARVIMGVCACDQPPPAPVPEGAEWASKHHRSSSLTLPNDSGNCDHWQRASLPLILVITHTTSENTRFVTH